jgi:SAM-dependent methyltransferase
MHVYDDEFFATADRTAAASARGVLDCLAGRLPIRSVLDLGCGNGVWLSYWLEQGVSDVVGVDGPYVDVRMLRVPPSAFLARDLGQPLQLQRQFDLVQSLETAEHLPPSAADQFVDNLVRHGKLVLFSAAIPGQGGEHHVNEQPLNYWRAKFRVHDYDAFDFVRPRVRNDRSIFFWYRHNAILYAHRSIVPALPAEILATRVEPERPIANDLPLLALASTAVVRRLPRPVVDRLARLKYQVLNWRHGLR